MSDKQVDDVQVRLLWLFPLSHAIRVGAGRKDMAALTRGHHKRRRAFEARRGTWLHELDMARDGALRDAAFNPNLQNAGGKEAHSHNSKWEEDGVGEFDG